MYFTQVTNSPNVSSSTAIQQLFAFSPWLSNNMSGVVSGELVCYGDLVPSPCLVRLHSGTLVEIARIRRLHSAWSSRSREV